MKVFGIVILILSFLALALILFKILTKMIGNGSHEEIKTQEANSKQAPKEVGIKDILELISDNNIGRNQLVMICNSFLKLQFPAQKDKAQEYLNFILLLSSHKNADAKLISFLNRECKKRNPSYANEIDNYEMQGLEARKKRK